MLPPAMVQKLQIPCVHLVFLSSLPKALISLPKEPVGAEKIMISTPQNFGLHLTYVFWTKLVFLILSRPLTYNHFHETPHFSEP